MEAATYAQRRGEIATYFDRTAAEAWKRLTSDAPVSGVRATVRAGRDRMRATLLGWLPVDLTGTSLLDAGCGTGALTADAGARGAAITAIDLSPTLVAYAREHVPTDVAARVDWRSGDMLDPALGRFDHVVLMDSLIHYRAADAVAALVGLAARTGDSILFTFAPRTTALALMHAVGRLFPRGDRAPSIEPVSEGHLRGLLARDLPGWRIAETTRISSGFYTSQAVKLVRT